ncbi:MAG: branched-chain amino acid transport system II carrier protein [Candidatus Babeliales bacterium]
MKNSRILSAGIAMFAMLFGSGNIVLSLAIGKDAGDKVGFALTGFLLGAVAIPLAGMIATMLVDGDYKKLLGRLGYVPGSLLTLIGMILLGPFGCIPRCIATSYAATKHYLPGVSIMLFSVIAALVIFAFTIKRSGVVDILGTYLGPIKLTLLIAIIVKGLCSLHTLPVSSLSCSHAFSKGLFGGYGTLDLISSIFFAGLIIASIKKHSADVLDSKAIAIVGLKAGAICATLLGSMYIGFCLVAAYNAPYLMHADRYELINVLAPLILGPQLGMIANITVGISCLATAIGISTVFADYLRNDLFGGNIGYLAALSITIVMSGIMANLGFKGIMETIDPIVRICYPALIVLSGLTIGKQMFGVRLIKIPVFITFLVTIITSVW